MCWASEGRLVVLSGKKALWGQGQERFSLVTCQGFCYNKRKICNWNNSCFLLLYILKVEVTSGIIAVILWSWCNMHRDKTKNCRDTASEPMIAISMPKFLHLGPYLQPFLMDRATQQSNTNLTHLCIQSFLFPGWIVPNTKFFKLMIFINKCLNHKRAIQTLKDR